MTMYYVATGADDYDDDSTTNTTLKIEDNNVFFPNPTEVYAYAKVTTSGIGTDDISAATVYWDEYSYSASRGTTKTYNVLMWNGSSYTNIGTFTHDKYPATRSIVLNATQRGWISKTGTTNFHITVDDPGTSRSRLLHIKAYETAQANAFRMDVTHAPAADPYYQAIVISS